METCTQADHFAQKCGSAHEKLAQMIITIKYDAGNKKLHANNRITRVRTETHLFVMKQILIHYFYNAYK